MRKFAKATALATLRAVGAFAWAARSQRRRNSLLILCYHGISLRDEHVWEPSLYITDEVFRSRLEALRRFRANVLPLGEGLDRLRAGTLPERSAVITFDDGFHDFYRFAVPALREYGYPATLYLTTHYCGLPMPIFNLAVNYLLWTSGRASITWPAGGIDTAAPCGTFAERWGVVQTLLQQAERQGLDTAGKDRMARSLAVELQIDYDDLVRSKMFQIMSEEETRKCVRAGIDLQLHTHRHRTPRDHEAMRREIADNRDRLRQYTGRDAVHFCYPSGDYDHMFLPWLREWGVVSATTCENGFARVEAEPLLLPRLLDGSQVSSLDFESWLCGLRG